MYKTIKELEAQKPSERLEFALDALEEMEQSPLYQVDMEHFHALKNGICFTCLGGAAAIKAIKGNFNEEVLWTSSFDMSQTEDGFDSLKFLRKVEYSLNAARMGYINTYLGYFGGVYGNKSFENHDVVRYERSPQEFKQCVREIIKKLKSENL